MQQTASSDKDTQIRLASNAALASLLNLTLLPVIAFVVLVRIYRNCQVDTIARYHAALGIKLNIIAALVLFAVSALMILLGGFDSPWTWVYVISYFTLVHSIFILVAVWALVRAWNGDRLMQDR